MLLPNEEKLRSFSKNFVWILLVSTIPVHLYVLSVLIGVHSGVTSSSSVWSGMGYGSTQWVMMQGGSAGQGLHTFLHCQVISTVMLSPIASSFVSNWDPLTHPYLIFVA